MNLSEVEGLTKKYADAYNDLADQVRDLNEVIEEQARAHLKYIKKAFILETERRGQLKAALEGATELFVQPKTVIFHGIKVGFAKGKGKINISDNTVELIEKNFPGLAETLIKIEKTPVKDSLAQLPAADLKKMGVTVADAGDEVVIRPVDSNVDKMVKALLKDSEEALKAA